MKKLTEEDKVKIIGCTAIIYNSGVMNIYCDKEAAIDYQDASRAYIVVGYKDGNIKLIPYTPSIDFPCWRSKMI